MRFSHTDFGSLVQALYSIEKGIAKELWSESSPTNSKGKKPLGGQRSGDVGAISLVGLRPPRCYQIVGQTSGLYYSPPPQQYRSRVPPQPYDQAYLPSTLALSYYVAQGIERPPISYSTPVQPCYAAQFVARPLASYPRHRAQ